ncbi:MAG: hypothetical protein HBSAPP03_20670 [Phycisphaerae bacterium]|nr:MAG: hypothetical protein HBSAPP03_20670 [Phycisphaerae bacterium]
MIQTWAMLVDAYRELNAKKLFWITLLISGLVVAAFAMVGLTEKGIKVIVWDIPVPMFNTTTIEPATFYKLIFSNLGIGFWLSWGATILAIISTASIFPDFVSSGSIELTLSKPISRLRLFLTKYATGLLFVTLQVAMFSLASFLVIGLRGGAWLPQVFWAVPIVVLFFSYLFSICTLVGLVTRSTIAALLVTVIMWLFFFGLNATDAVFVQLREQAVLREKALVTRVDNLEKRAAQRVREKRQAALDLDPAATPRPDDPVTPEDLDADNPRLPAQRQKLADERESVAKWSKWSRLFVGIKTPLPKTAETIEVLERVLISEAELARFRAPGDEEEFNVGERDDVRISGREMRQSTEKALKSRSLWWVMGTSAGFEAVVLLIAGWIFCRRDF